MPYLRSDFITRTPTEDVAFDYMQNADAFIADKLFPAKPVSKRETAVYQFDTSKLRMMETRKATNSEADLVNEQLFRRSITLDEHKLGAEVNPMDVRDADIPQLVGDARKVKQVTNHLLLKKESLAATLATTSGNYMSTLTSAIASGSRWNETNGDPEADKTTADNALILTCGMMANAAAMDIVTYNKLRISPDFRDRVKFTQSGPVTEEAIKAFFHLDYFFVGRARYDSAVEGATKSMTSIWSDNVVFFYYNPSPGLEDMSFGHTYLMKTPFWTSIEPDPKRKGPAGPMRRVEVGTEYSLGYGFVESSSSTKFAAGYLFRTSVA